MVQHLQQLAAAGVPWGHASRHMLGLRNSTPGARRWRQAWSDPIYRAGPPDAAQRAAREALSLQNRALVDLKDSDVSAESTA
jgi:tRNA-dihydrouridine synthase A